jgi:undecaprenyl-diphosphatase
LSVLAAVQATELRLASRLSLWHPPRFIRVLLLSLTRMGDGWGWIALAAALLLGARAYREVMAGTLAAAAASAAFCALKRRFKRRRPCEILGILQDDVRPADRFSFPSGHAATSFAIATVLTLAFPPLAGVFLAMAVAIASSRVALGLHYVSDVVAGATLGAAVGALSYAVLLG